MKMPHVSYAQRRAKRRKLRPHDATSHIVAADTTVVIDDHILEKPIDLEDAKRMLHLLNNRWHQVLTGVAVNRSSQRRQ